MADVSVHVFGTSRGYASCQRDTPRPIPRANINRVARLRRIFSGRHARRGGNVEPRAARFSESCRDLAIILRGSNLFIYLFLKIARCPAVPSDLNTSRYVPPPLFCNCASSCRAKSGLSRYRRATKSRGDTVIAGYIRERPRAVYRERIVTVHNFPWIGTRGDRRVITA